MAYTTGITTGCADFLQKLATAAAAVGWTVDHNAAVTSDGWWLAMHNGTGCYVDLHAKAADNQIDCYGATGYNGANSYNNQTGSPSQFLSAFTGVASSFIGYHIFTQTTTSPYINAVIEVSSGVFVHIQFGTLVSANGGGNVNYVTCSSTTSPNGSFYYSFPQYQFAPWGESNATDTVLINATVDSTNRWFRNQSFASSPARALCPMVNASAQSPLGHQLYYAAVKSQPNQFNGLPVLLPLPVCLERAAGGLWAYVGDVLDVRQVSLQSNAPKDEITIGSDVWKLFPVGTKGSNVNIGNAPYCTGYAGYAFRKNA